MANCIRCGAEIMLYVNGTPLCVDCDNETPAPTYKSEPPQQQEPASKADNVFRHGHS